MIIHEQIPLNDKNWFKTGGPARFFCEPQCAATFQEALSFARSNGLAVFVLGQGANLLVSDAGFDGLVIRPKNSTITFVGDRVVVGAGVDMETLITTCLDHNLVGLEEFSGIPGTVGGSVYINIHYFQFLLSQFLVAARVIDAITGEVFEVTPAWFNFGYDQSTLMDKRFYLVDATLQLRAVTPLEAAYARGRSVEIIRHRRQRYPYANTCGSFFRNFHPEEVPFEINGKKLCFVAYYLDKLGVKGVLQVGGAIVSYQHANMIVTQPGATSADIVGLVRALQQKVFEAYGITPQAECQLVGFTEHPFF